MAQSTGGGGRLPDEYQEVQYLVTDSYAYITLQDDFYSALPGFDVKYRKTQSIDQYGPHLISHGAQNIWVAPRPSDSGMVSIRGEQTHGWGASSVGTDYQVAMGADGTSNVYVDGVFVLTATVGTSTQAGRLGLFYYPADTARRWKFKGWCYYVKIYDAQSLVYDLVPCYRKIDSVPGLYCLVHNAFFPNSNNTGAFSVGPNV